MFEADWLRFLRSTNQTPKIMAARTPIPPMTPPTIAPIGVDFFFEIGNGVLRILIPISPVLLVDVGDLDGHQISTSLIAAFVDTTERAFADPILLHIVFLRIAAHRRHLR